MKSWMQEHKIQSVRFLIQFILLSSSNWFHTFIVGFVMLSRIKGSMNQMNSVKRLPKATNGLILFLAQPYAFIIPINLLILTLSALFYDVQVLSILVFMVYFLVLMYDLFFIRQFITALFSKMYQVSIVLFFILLTIPFILHNDPKIYRILYSKKVMDGQNLSSLH